MTDSRERSCCACDAITSVSGNAERAANVFPTFYSRPRLPPFYGSQIHQMKINHSIISILAVSTLVLTGCASVDMASKEQSDQAKQFSAPSAGNSGLYVYRNSFVGKALKKDIWVDGKCLGESASDVFFYTQVEGGKKHKIETESEFSPNALEVAMEAGKNYFVRQFIKLGAFVGGADLELIPEEQGKVDVAKLEMAKPGTCSQ